MTERKKMKLQNGLQQNPAPRYKYEHCLEYDISLQTSSTGLLCCCGGTVTPEPGPDRVELAFKRMDKNKDGFITWDEFNKVR